jgi:hypothetical protein
MKALIKNIPITGLRPIHFDQLMHYLEVRDHEKWYFGNKKHFEKRHEELRQWLTNTINLMESRNE